MPQRVLTNPPSILRSEPVILPARSLARNTTRSATCCGVVNRPVAAVPAVAVLTCSAVRPLAPAIESATPPSSSYIPVDTGPGLIELTRMFFGPNSFDNALPMFVTAALVAQ